MGCVSGRLRLAFTNATPTPRSPSNTNLRTNEGADTKRFNCTQMCFNDNSCKPPPLVFIFTAGGVGWGVLPRPNSSSSRNGLLWQPLGAVNKTGPYFQDDIVFNQSHQKWRQTMFRAKCAPAPTKEKIRRGKQLFCLHNGFLDQSEQGNCPLWLAV